MEPFLECRQNDRIEFESMLKKAEHDYEEKYNVSLSLQNNNSSHDLATVN